VNYLAMTGYIACQADALPGATVADSAGGGMQAAISILAALLARERTGEGAYLDVNTTNGSLYLMALQVDQFLATGEEAGPGTTLLTGKYACYGIYPCRDGKAVSVGAIEAQFFANLCAALGVPQHAASQYDDDQQDTIREAFRAAFLLRDRDDWVAELAPKDTCVAPVLSVREVAEAFPTQETAAGFRQLAPLIAGSVR
jgi:alpha-methylacyl-CoA racemase